MKNVHISQFFFNMKESAMADHIILCQTHVFHLDYIILGTNNFFLQSMWDYDFGSWKLEYFYVFILVSALDCLELIMRIGKHEWTQDFKEGIAQKNR